MYITILLTSIYIVTNQTFALKRPSAKSKNAWTHRQKNALESNSKIDNDYNRDEIDEKNIFQDEWSRRLKAETFPEAESPEDHLVTSLPYLSPDAFPTKHYAGHISAHPQGTSNIDKKLFYWLFEPPPEMAKNAPLLIWLNGGPGCSSMDGLFLENGPFRLVRTEDQSSWNIEINPFSWHNIPAYTLYIDQPVGTGLSFTNGGNYCGSDQEVNTDFYNFLQNFLILYKDDMLLPDMSKMKRDLYFSGESHAGHYIPSMMDFILNKNDEIESPINSDFTENNANIFIPLQGGAIGNGWVDPYHQYAAATVAAGYGLIDFSQWAVLNKKEIECHQQMDKGDLDSTICFDLLDDIVNDSPGSAGVKVSSYDIRLWEPNGHRNFPFGHKDVEAYLGRPSSYRNNRTPNADPPMMDSDEVLEAIHASEATKAKQYYKECTDPPWEALVHQDGKGVVDELVRALHHYSKPKFLFFNGVLDLICNHAGNERVLDMLPWKYAKEWTIAKRYAWDASKINKDSKKPAGYVKAYKNLIFLKILDSGHMVPMDQPAVALEMMRTFIYNDDGFYNKEQKHLKGDIPGDIGQCTLCKDGCDEKEINNESLPMQQNKTEFNNEIKVKSIVSSGFIGMAWMGAFLVLILFLVLRKRARGTLGGRYGYKSSNSDFTYDDSDTRFDDEPGITITGQTRTKEVI